MISTPSIRALVVVWILGLANVVFAESPAPYRGQLLPEALTHLQEQGLRLIYSKNVIKPWMRVYENPTQSELAEVLKQILKPHGLTAEIKAAETWVVVEDEQVLQNRVGSLRGKVFDSQTGAPITQALITSNQQQVGFATLEDGTFLASGLGSGSHTLTVSAPGYKLAQVQSRVRLDRTNQIEIAIEPESPRIDEIKIIASRHEMYSNSHNGGQFLSREDVDRAPHVADDLSRAVARLPGLAGGDIFARLNLRGGRPNEIRVNLDGL
ncbi:MAG: carboxypeptidase regulatory-like domain-containing protein, partial [Pseudomonadota bacterium]